MVTSCYTAGVSLSLADRGPALAEEGSAQLSERQTLDQPGAAWGSSHPLSRCLSDMTPHQYSGEDVEKLQQVENILEQQSTSSESAGPSTTQDPTPASKAELLKKSNSEATPEFLATPKPASEAQKERVPEEEERRRQRKSRKGRIQELEQSRSELAAKEQALLDREQELMDKDQTVIVLREEARLLR